MKVSTKHDVGLLLAERRRQLGMTQHEFAAFVGVPRLWVAQVETGATNPTLSRLLDVIRRAGLTLSLDGPGVAAVPLRRERAELHAAGPTREPIDLDHHLRRFSAGGELP